MEDYSLIQATIHAASISARSDVQDACSGLSLLSNTPPSAHNLRVPTKLSNFVEADLNEAARRRTLRVR
jgi:hypothetical protein